MFTEQEKKEFIEDGLTEEEIDELETSMAICETVDLLPDNFEEFLKEYKSKIPDDTFAGMKAIMYSAQNDQEFFKKLMAICVAMGLDMNAKEIKEESFPVLEGLTKEEYKKASDNYFKTIAGLDENDKKEFLKLIMNITPEQKADMIERLKSN